jgi:hypothetical protein
MSTGGTPRSPDSSGAARTAEWSVMLDMEVSALFYGVLTWIVTLPALTTSPMASAAPGVLVGSRREPEPAHGPGGLALRLGG